MFRHTHPYKPYTPEGTTKLIVGTLPPPRFTRGILKDDDVDFCYGSRDGQLWKILDAIFSLNLVYEPTRFAIDQRMDFLKSRKLGIFDIVDSAERERIDATDLGMKNIVLRDLLGGLKKLPKVDTLLFTGGNSKNGPEYFFRKHLKSYGLSLKLVNDEIPRIHEFEFEGRRIRTVSLTAPSGSANRAVGSNLLYKKRKMLNPEYNTIDFRIEQYRPFF